MKSKRINKLPDDIEILNEVLLNDEPILNEVLLNEVKLDEIKLNEELLNEELLNEVKLDEVQLDEIKLDEVKLDEVRANPNQINKGNKAGGANTNVNGLSYEDKTDLSCLYISCIQEKKEKKRTIKFEGYNEELINVNKSALHKYMSDIGEKNINLQPAAGCKEPDEAYIDNSKKAVYIIEKKFQQTPGSVDEKLQTGPFKKHHYSKLFPNYKVHYIYCLSDWFKREEYTSVLEYLSDSNIPIFWGNDTNYKSLMIDFICFKT